MMRFHLLSVFWGDEFTDRFGRIALRSLLAPGNLPALASGPSVVYHVYTTAADAERLSGDPAFKEAARHVEFRVNTVALSDSERTNPSSHWMLWHRGAAELREAEDVLITVAPDHLFSRDTMTRWADLFRDGQLAVFGSGVLVVLETVLEELSRTFPGHGPIDIGLDDLQAMMFRHLHPVKITMLRGSARNICHPEEHYRSIDGHGFVQNVMGSHAVAFRPRAINVNAHFCPVDHLDRIAYEPCRYLSLEPALKALPLYLQPWRFDDRTLSQYGEWSSIYAFDVNLAESRQSHVYAVGRPIPEIERRRAELGARFFVSQMHASRSIYRVWRALGDAGRSRAAQWVAAAQMHARLRRRIVPRLPATIFVPNESVFGRLPPDERVRLLANRGRALIEVLRAHIAEGRHAIKPGARLVPSAEGPIRMMNGACYSVANRGEVRVTAGPIRVDDVEIYFVNRPLAPLVLGPPRIRDVRVIRSTFMGVTGFLIRSAWAARLRLRQARKLHARVLRARDWWRGRVRADAARPDGIDKTSPPVAAYVRGLERRSLDAIRQLYRFYADTVLTGTGVVAVPQTRFGLEQASRPTAEDALSDAVRLSPSFAEAWLELGFARLLAGETDAALEAFTQASTAKPTLPAAPNDPDPRVIAAVERARLLIDRNDPQAALAALEAAPRVGPMPPSFREMRARLLVDAGRINHALVAFSRCMTGYASVSTFAGMLPRKADSLYPRQENATEAPTPTSRNARLE